MVQMSPIMMYLIRIVAPFPLLLRRMLKSCAIKMRNIIKNISIATEAH
jgi:hypothetical protein